MNGKQHLRLRRKFTLSPHTHPSHHPPHPPPHVPALSPVFTRVKTLEQKLEQRSPDTWVLLQVEAAWILALFLFPFSLQATPGTLTLPLSWGPVWTEAGNPSSPPMTRLGVPALSRPLRDYGLALLLSCPWECSLVWLNGEESGAHAGGPRDVVGV